MSGALWAPALWVGVLGIGGFGAMARFMVDRTVSRRMKGPFPFGTLVVNISGAALLGFLAGLTVSHEVAILAGTGIANQQCEAGLAQYTGLAANNTPFAISYLIDSEQDRTSNNPYPSTVICLLQDAQGQTRTASARR